MPIATRCWFHRELVCLGGVGLSHTPRARCRDRGTTGLVPICVPPYTASLPRILDGPGGLDISSHGGGFGVSSLATLYRLVSRVVRSTGWMNISI